MVPCKTKGSSNTIYDLQNHQTVIIEPLWDVLVSLPLSLKELEYRYVLLEKWANIPLHTVENALKCFEFKKWVNSLATGFCRCVHA